MITLSVRAVVGNRKDFTINNIAAEIAPVKIASDTFKYHSLNIFIGFYNTCFCRKYLNMCNTLVFFLFLE